MSAHEKGIEAAGRDWLQQTGMLLINDEFESAIRAYLEASGQVLVPREPAPEIHEAWRPMYRSLIATIEAYPQPFSQPGTEGEEA